MLNLPVDAKQNAKVQRLRQQMEQRKQRILNPKQYALGIDLQGVEQQIQEKQLQRRRDKEIDEAIEKLMIRNDHVAQELQRRMLMERVERDKDIEAFRRLYQGRERSREWDLNSKAGILGNSIEEAKLGPSAAQRFQGEDVESQEKRLWSMRQQHDWLQQQIAEKRQLRDQERRDNEQYDAYVRSLNSSLQDLETAKEQCRRFISEATNQLNKRLMEEKQARREEAKQQLSEKNRIHVEPSHHEGCKDHDEFRGMSKEEVDNIRKQQLQQIQERKQRETKMAQEEEQWARMLKHYEAMYDHAADEASRRRRDLLLQLQKENAHLAEEQKHRRVEEKFAVNTDEFFKHFGTSAR